MLLTFFSCPYIACFKFSILQQQISAPKAMKIKQAKKSRRVREIESERQSQIESVREKESERKSQRERSAHVF